MKINPTAAMASLRSKSQLFFLGILGVILLLEVSFSFFDILPRSVTIFDLQSVTLIAILVCARPKLFQSTFWLAFKRIPVIYQICLFITIYIVVIKASYFIGYFVGMIF